MLMRLSELVVFAHENERPAMAAVKRAVRWLYQKPEGKELLVNAKQLHGKPVHVYAGEFGGNGFDVYDSIPCVIINPKLLKSQPLIAADGSIIEHHSLERLVSHEFTHAAQPHVAERAIELAQVKARLQADCTPQPPFEIYRHRISIAKSDGELSEVAGEMWDQHFLPKLPEAEENYRRKLSEDPVVQAFVEEFELPAVKFENAMVTKYRSEKPRTLDYISSAAKDPAPTSAHRDAFIQNVVEQIKTSREAESARIAVKDPHEVRLDASPKSTGDNKR